MRRFVGLLAVMLAISAAVSSLQEMGPPIRGLRLADLRDTFSETHNGHAHEAIDILEPRGTPVLAVVPGTIRKLFAESMERNAVHGSDAPETAAQEIPFFFSAAELL